MGSDPTMIEFTKTRANSAKAKRKVPMLEGSGWLNYLEFIMTLYDYATWQRYSFDDEDYMEEFHEDLQLLLQGDEWRLYMASAHDGEFFADKVMEGMNALTQNRCPPGIQKLLAQIREQKKKRGMTVFEFSQMVNRMYRMISVLLHVEAAPVSLVDKIEWFKEAMPVDWQIEFNRLYGMHDITSMQQIETIFGQIERNETVEQNIRRTQEKIPRNKHSENKQSNYKHSENKHSNNKHSGNPNPGKSKTANSTHTKQKPTSKECSFCKTKGYTYGNHKDDECGRKDNPKNAPNSRSDSSSSNQIMALLKEMRELRTVVDNMKAAFYDDDEAIPHVNAAMR
ncbi:unnamed protein product, partial [Aphanomyces euteiches]